MTETLGIIVNEGAQSRIASLPSPDDPQAHRLNLVPRDLLVKVFAADAEYARALGLISFSSDQHLSDVIRFQFSEALRLRLTLLRTHRRTQPRGQILIFDPLSRRDDHRAFDDVREFARIPGIVVSLQHRARAGRQTLHLAPVLG